jgi:hypothetical protein
MQSQTIKVVIRTKPSTTSSEQNVITVEEDSSVISIARGDRKGQADFTFHHVLGPRASQCKVYGVCNVVDEVIGGINCCVMAYGQTGSGKTYTMYGEGWEDGESPMLATVDIPEDIPGDDKGVYTASLSPDDDAFGIIPRSVSDLFKALDAKSCESKSFEFSVSKCN